MSRMLEALKRLETKKTPTTADGLSQGPATAAATAIMAEDEAETDTSSAPAESPAGRFNRQSPVGDAFEPAALAHLQQPAIHDQYARLAENIVSSVPCGPPATVALVGLDGATRGTELSVRLGIVLAENGAGRVLLIDGDSAHGRLSGGFALGDRQGLSDLMRGQGDRQSLVCSTATENLFLLPAGKGMLQPATGLAALPAVWHDCGQYFSWMLIDAGSAERPMARELARTCDAAYVVVELGQTHADAAAVAVEQLQSAGARVLGCVVTGTDENA